MLSEIATTGLADAIREIIFVDELGYICECNVCLHLLTHHDFLECAS